VSPAITDPYVLTQVYYRRQKRHKNATTPAFVSAIETVQLPPGYGGLAASNVTVGQVALGFELLLSQVGGQHRAPWGEGTTLFGVDTLMDRLTPRPSPLCSSSTSLT